MSKHTQGVHDKLLDSSIGSGVFISLLQSPMFSMGSMHDVGQRIGMCFTIVSIGSLAGPPISGAINAATGGFVAVGFYAGTSLGLDRLDV